MEKKRVAVVADIMTDFGGAEKVTETLLKIFPEADFYTLLITPMARQRIRQNYPGVKIYTSGGQKFLQPGKYLSLIKLFSWIYWERMDLRSYDLVISSSHSFMSKNVKKRPGAFHVSYVHTPPRYLYDEFNEIGIIKKFPVNILFQPARQILKFIDRRGAWRPDMILANSENVRQRIKKYYGREAKVVYPPVKVPEMKAAKGDYFVWVSRLVRQKGAGLAIRTAVKNNFKLKIIGNGPELNNLKKKAGRNIEFFGSCPDSQKFKLMAGARALLYTSVEEDFGMVPAETLKLGVPVIAFNSGGVKEIVADGKNGVLFDDFNEKSLTAAVRRFNELKFDRKKVIESAQKFGEENFIKAIKKITDG